MGVTVRLPGSLRDAVGGDNKVSAAGRTLDEVFADIERRHPGFRSLVIDDRGELRTYVNVYIGTRTLGPRVASPPASPTTPR